MRYYIRLNLQKSEVFPGGYHIYKFDNIATNMCQRGAPHAPPKGGQLVYSPEIIDTFSGVATFWEASSEHLKSNFNMFITGVCKCFTICKKYI